MSNEHTKELEPCPFLALGGKHSLETKEDANRWKPFQWIVTCWCGATGPQRSTEAGAITAWNTRRASVVAPRGDALQKAVTDFGYLIHRELHNRETEWHECELGVCRRARALLSPTTAEPTPGADGRYCAHHDDDPAHGKECYAPAPVTAPVSTGGVCVKCGHDGYYVMANDETCAADVHRDGEVQPCGCKCDFTAATSTTPVDGEQDAENRGIKSSALYQRYARMWSSTEGIERRFSLHDRYIAVRDAVHAIDHVRKRNDLPFDVQANAQMILMDGIYNALDHRATGREWRNIRHTYNPERDGPHPPTEAEEDRRCATCGAIRPMPFSHCHAKNHVGTVAATLTSTEYSEGFDDAARVSRVLNNVAATEAGEQEFGDSFVTAVNAIKSISEDRRATALAMLNNYFAAPAAPSPGEPPPFRTTKEAMEWAQSNHVPTVIPVTADRCEHGVSLDHDCLHCENQQDEINVARTSVEGESE